MSPNPEAPELGRRRSALADATLREFLAELGMQLPGGEIPRPKDYAQLLERIRKRPDFALLQTILLRSLKQAVYSPSNVGHFGLAFAAYVHFTSPIRRYPDLLVHRAIKAVLQRKQYSGVDWEALGLHCSETERRARGRARNRAAWSCPSPGSPGVVCSRRAVPGDPEGSRSRA